MCNFEAFFSFFYIFCLSVLAVRLYKRKPLIFVLRKMACKYHFRQMFQQILCLHWYMNYSTQNKTDSAWITKPVHCLIYSAIGAFLLYVCICRLTASLYERSRQPRGLLPGHQPTTLILTVKRLLRHKSSLMQSVKNGLSLIWNRCGFRPAKCGSRSGKVRFQVRVVAVYIPAYTPVCE